MTFTTRLKEEITKQKIKIKVDKYELIAFLNCIAKIDNKEMLITMENASVARRIYKEIKELYGVNPQIIVRIQKRFKVKQIYILSINSKLKEIEESLKFSYNDLNFLKSKEERIAFLRGAFLAIGNISNPSTSGYHLEFILKNEKLAKYILDILLYFKLGAKRIKRGYKTVVYIKAAEDISDLIKYFEATGSLFYFEDIRIYRDHKNMVNRLNNCEIANQEKTIKVGMEQAEKINYLMNEGLFDLLDDKTKMIAIYRKNYPELSFQELASVITNETNYKIGKSGINHHFIKINELIKKHKETMK